MSSTLEQLRPRPADRGGGFGPGARGQAHATSNADPLAPFDEQALPVAPSGPVNEPAYRHGFEPDVASEEALRRFLAKLWG